MNETELTELNHWYEQKNELIFLDKSIMKEKNERMKGKKTEEFFFYSYFTSFWFLIAYYLKCKS